MKLWLFKLGWDTRYIEYIAVYKNNLKIFNFIIFQIEKIGDCYMVVSGLPSRKLDQKLQKVDCGYINGILIYDVNPMP